MDAVRLQQPKCLGFLTLFYTFDIFNFSFGIMVLIVVELETYMGNDPISFKKIDSFNIDTIFS